MYTISPLPSPIFKTLGIATRNVPQQLFAIMYPTRVLVFFLACLLTSLIRPCRGQNVGIETSPIFKGSNCDAIQERIIRQALSDAVSKSLVELHMGYPLILCFRLQVLLANAAFDNSDELLSTTGRNNKILNFDTEAAIEYWGPPSKNLGYRQRIYDTFYRGTQATEGRGWADWWFERYIEMHCDDPDEQCKEFDVAYYMPTQKGSWTYDGLNFCPAFFSRLKDHSELEKDIFAEATGQKKLNTRNMRSRGKLYPQTLTRSCSLLTKYSLHRFPRVATCQRHEDGNLSRRM